MTVRGSRRSTRSTGSTAACNLPTRNAVPWTGWSSGVDLQPCLTAAPFPQRTGLRMAEIHGDRWRGIQGHHGVREVGRRQRASRFRVSSTAVHDQRNHPRNHAISRRRIPQPSTSPPNSPVTLVDVATPTPSSEPVDAPAPACLACNAPTTPHCTGRHCVWVRCVNPACGKTHHPARLDLGAKVFPPDSRYEMPK